MVTATSPVVAVRVNVISNGLGTGEVPIAATLGSPVMLSLFVALHTVCSGGARREALATMADDRQGPGDAASVVDTNVETVVASDVVLLIMSARHL